MKTPNHANQTPRSASAVFFRQATLITLFIVIGSGLLAFKANANQVLLFYDADFVMGLGTSRYRAALDHRGYPYQYFSDATAFGQAVQAANPASDVVVVDALALFYNLSSVTAFVQAGGRALVQYWNLAGDPGPATALEVSVSGTLAQATSPHDWGGSELFTGIGSPLVLTAFTAENITHGQRLEPIGGGQAVAGFVGAPTANQAALVIGNSGRTIAQGFFSKEIELTQEAIQFAQNELDFLFGPIAPDVGPSIISNTKIQTVLTGGSTTIRVQAGGKLPLSYQSQKDGADIPGATNALYSISKAQLDQTGSYSVIVSNHHFAVSSGAAILTVTDPAPITNTLRMDDDSVFPSPYADALIQLGLNYQTFSDPAAFNSAVALASPADTLVILDAYGSPWRYSELVDFVEAGGRALMQNWYLAAGSHLAKTFEVSVGQTIDTILPVYDWSGSGFFDGVMRPVVSTPLPFPYTPNVHGQKLHPLPGGTAVAGYVNSPTANEAAIVIGNAGRTIANGFMFEEITPQSEAIKLARNQILHFNLAPPPTSQRRIC